MTEWEQTLALNKCLKELDALRQERDSLKIDLDQASLYLRSSELSERVLEAERDALKAEHDRLKEENVKLKQKVWGLEQAVEIVRARSFEQQIEDLERQVKIAVEALRGLVRCNEEWNAAVQDIVGRPAGWNDNYLTQARKALSEIAAAKGVSGER